ncbi:hypothetical protein ECZU51_07330 [Escherichia coli]|nr:hypothetical protein ECZU51_07330 [Escherichia coli]
MPPFCLGVGATAIGDFGSAAGELPVPVELAEACAHAVMKSGIDLAVSYCMQVDHGFAQPLEFLLGGLDKVPVLPVFINGVATPLPGFQRTRMLGKPLDVSPALSINACCSWVRWAFPSATGTRTGESRCPYARPSVGERERFTRQ